VDRLKKLNQIPIIIVPSFFFIKKMIMKKKWKIVVTLPNTGIKTRDPYTFAFVYSNKGNFLVKGYLTEVENFLKKEKEKGLKYFANFTFFNKGKNRGYWKFYKDNTFISEKCFNRHYKYLTTPKWIFRNNKKDISVSFKRLPKKWVKELEVL
jgi:hypothetical protein